jgi:hypothetical protein
MPSDPGNQALDLPSSRNCGLQERRAALILESSMRPLQKRAGPLWSKRTWPPSRPGRRVAGQPHIARYLVGRYRGDEEGGLRQNLVSCDVPKLPLGRRRPRPSSGVRGHHRDRPSRRPQRTSLKSRILDLQDQSRMIDEIIAALHRRYRVLAHASQPAASLLQGVHRKRGLVATGAPYCHQHP